MLYANRFISEEKGKSFNGLRFQLVSINIHVFGFSYPECSTCSQDNWTSSFHYTPFVLHLPSSSSSQHTFLATLYLDSLSFPAPLSHVPTSLHIFYPLSDALGSLFLLNYSCLFLKAIHLLLLQVIFLMLLCELDASFQPWFHNPWFLCPKLVGSCV